MWRRTFGISPQSQRTRLALFARRFALSRSVFAWATHSRAVAWSLRACCRSPSACLIASSNDADPVAHASLIFHQHCYNPRMEQWLQKLHNQPLLAVI